MHFPPEINLDKTREKTTFEITCDAMWRGARPFLVLAEMGAPRCSIMSTTFSWPDLQKYQVKILN
jgi:hypothetical protein